MKSRRMKLEGQVTSTTRRYEKGMKNFGIGKTKSDRSVGIKLD
jgi:hypothetical protein